MLNHLAYIQPLYVCHVRRPFCYITLKQYGVCVRGRPSGTKPVHWHKYKFFNGSIRSTDVVLSLGRHYIAGLQPLTQYWAPRTFLNQTSTAVQTATPACHVGIRSWTRALSESASLWTGSRRSTDGDLSLGRHCTAGTQLLTQYWAPRTFLDQTSTAIQTATPV